MREQGLTLVEMLVVLSVLVVVIAAVVVLTLPSGAGRLARDLQALMLAARLEALVRERPVAVVWQAGAETFEVREAGTGGTVPEACLGRVIQRLKVARYPRAEVVRSLSGNVVWLPVGLGRSCTGGAVFNGTIEIRGSRERHRVIIAAGGRVRTEEGP